MSDNTPTEWPMPRNLLVKTVNYAKSMPSYKEALPIINYMETMFRGYCIQEAFEMIDSVNDYFKKDIDEQIERRAKEIIDKKLNSMLDLAEFDLDDDQIETAILKTESKINSHRDWAGIFVVLVDCCKWPSVYTEFETRINKLDLSKMPAEKKFTYQGLQTGYNDVWPKKYKKWLCMNSEVNSFNQRKEVAIAFYNNLKEQQAIKEQLLK